MRKRVLLSLILFCGFTLAQAQYSKDISYVQRFFFKVGKANIDESLDNNYQAIDSILYKLRDLKNDGAENIRIHIYGSASLEASDEYNTRLSSRRAQNLIEFLRKFKLTNDVEMIPEGVVYDFSVLSDYVSKSECPQKENLLSILRIPSGTISIAERKQRIMNLDGGNVYDYISTRFFKYMRYSRIEITAKGREKAVMQGLVSRKPVTDEFKVREKDTIYIDNRFPYKGVFGVRTNLLFDAALIPNIGVDVYVNKNISVGANWMYTWIKTDRSSNYWRAYGGDIHGDYWFDPTLMWSGHHVGVYAQMATFDVEWGGRGFQAPKWLVGGGLSYGYSWWLSNNFSLDFGIGIGYLRGKFYEYNPSKSDDKIYYIEKSKTLNWVGPTKAEISLIWKIGNESKNR